MKFHYGRMLTDKLDGRHGIPRARLDDLNQRFPEVLAEVGTRRQDGDYGFYGLGDQDETVQGIRRFAEGIGQAYDHVLVLGIGGSSLGTKALVTIGNFNAPASDVITDLAVAPNNTIYVISATALYTASASDGHVTKLGSLSACGSRGVALTTTANGDLWMGDFKGKLCKIDISGATPVVGAAVTMSGGMALAGDFVGIGDGTIFGTAYNLSDASTQNNNSLVKIDVTTGTVTMIGPTGFPKLFGTSFQNNVVFGFTHDGTGHVVTIDRTTGVGTLYATFMDPATHMGISFAGAGVSSLVVIE